MTRINYQALLFFILTLFFLSCNSEASKSEALYNDVMVIHDEVMPKMSKIHRLQKQLKNIDLEANPNIDKDAVTKHIKNLEGADEAMMNWMAKFKMPQAEDDASTTIAYLEQEKENIKGVSKIMLSSIQEAKDFLEKNAPKK